jgi:hypothetical protein
MAFCREVRRGRQAACRSRLRRGDQDDDLDAGLVANLREAFSDILQP